MKNSILVTGGLGYIGKNTIYHLSQHLDNDLIIIDNLSNSSLDSLSILKKLINNKVYFYDVDIRDSSKINDVLNQHQIDSVIHFAALKSVNESIRKPGLYFDNNVLGLLNLIEIIQKYRVKNFIFSSSATVYAEYNQFPVSESDPLGYKNPYGQTKLISEDILKRMHDAFGINVGILRYFNPLGNLSNGFFGDQLNDAAKNIMPMIYKSLLYNLPFSIFGDNYDTKDGTPVRDYIHVEDLANAHYLMHNHLFEKGGFHIFNVGLGSGTSVLELINKFCDINNVHIPIEFHDRREGDLAICYANADKLKKELHWRPTKNLDDMCLDSYHFLTQSLQKKNFN